MKLKILVVVFLFLTVLNIATIGTFLYMRFDGRPRGARDMELRHQPPPPRPGGAPGGNARHPRVRFSHEEMERMKALLDRFRNETRDHRSRVHALEDETLTLMKEDPVKRTKVDSLLREISVAQFEITRKAADILIEAKSFLSEEQSSVFYDSILRARPGPADMPPPPPPGDDR